MPKIRSSRAKKPLSADAIGKLAAAGEDVSAHFTNRGRMMPAVQRVNVDFTSEMLADLDEASRELNVSRQAIIKVFLRQALDQHYLAKKAHRTISL
jgi:hypothetical protein